MSEARGYVVRKYLVDNFQLDDKRVKTLGLGKTADSSPEGSVQILIYAGAPAVPPTSPPAVAARKAPAKD